MVGNAGNCDGTLVVVSNHVMEHGGVNTVLRSERRSPNTSRCAAVGLADAMGEAFSVYEKVE